MNHKYFPDYEDIKERLENLVTHAENKDFGDLDLKMEGLYFNIEDMVDLLVERFEEYNISLQQTDNELKVLIARASSILFDNF